MTKLVIIRIASNTYKEVVRDKVYYVLFAFSFLIIAFSFVLGRLSLGESRTLIMDMSFFAMELIGVLISVFVGITLVYREVERKTIFSILSKPVKRSEFVIGKFVGLISSLVVAEAAMLAITVALLKLRGVSLDLSLLIVFASILLEICLVLSCAVLFSVLSSPITSGIFTISFYMIGNMSYLLKEVYLGTEEANHVISAVFYIIPNFHIFDFSYEVVHLLPIEWGRVLIASGYAIAYILLLLTVAVAAFERKDIF